MFDSPRVSLDKGKRRTSSQNDGVDVADYISQLEAQENNDKTSGDNDELSVTEQGEVREACFLFAVVGIGYLFPFSALTQPVDYWNLLFPDFNIEFPLTTLYMWSNLIMLAMLVFLGGRPNFTRRIVGGFV